jgi:hypothetical protein
MSGASAENQSGNPFFQAARIPFIFQQSIRILLADIFSFFGGSYSIAFLHCSLKRFKSKKILKQSFLLINFPLKAE